MNKKIIGYISLVVIAIIMIILSLIYFDNQKRLYTLKSFKLNGEEILEKNKYYYRIETSSMQFTNDSNGCKLPYEITEYTHSDTSEDYKTWSVVYLSEGASYGEIKYYIESKNKSVVYVFDFYLDNPIIKEDNCK